MLRPDDMLKLLQKRPFEPFRIYLTDSKTYDIKHPELVITGERFLIVGEPRPGKNGAVAASYDTVTLMHIVRLEPINLTAAG
jgi:hypothetical protein